MWTPPWGSDFLLAIVRRCKTRKVLAHIAPLFHHLHVRHERELRRRLTSGTLEGMLFRVLDAIGQSIEEALLILRGLQ